MSYSQKNSCHKLTFSLQLEIEATTFDTLNLAICQFL